MPRVVHFEIHAGDPERAVSFYQTLFGWNFQKWEGPMEYWMVITGPDDQPGINGGLMRRHGELDGQAVIAYVCTVDVADRVAEDGDSRSGLVGLLQGHRRKYLRDDAERSGSAVSARRLFCYVSGHSPHGR
jgi:predicted enzyme related to lactoylglutathione lyase